MSTLTLTALVRAERFMSGFEDDPKQVGIAHDLATIRAAIDAQPVDLRLRQSARALLEAVDFDNNGSIVAGVRVGGNGGLVSPDTTRAADQLRRVLEQAEQLRIPIATSTPAPERSGHYDRDGYCDNPARGF